MRRPTMEEIMCVHDFQPSHALPEDQWACTKCGGVQTQFPSCNGNCKCGGKE